ncbi:pumilio homolog 3-like [Anneissia japonica]|uniref:pumilio homolog 3-like n=1 Tax=Anneissia japonica TaxID=1529436 RepID=UPI001425A470|nr:pumilio homolog 3-like [Anneissia japonica]
MEKKKSRSIANSGKIKMQKKLVKSSDKKKKTLKKESMSVKDNIFKEKSLKFAEMDFEDIVAAEGDGEEQMEAKEMKESKRMKKEKPEKGTKRKSTEDPDKPNILQMSKKQRKDVRKQVKTNYELAQKSKKMWEVLRQEKCTKEKRQEILNELRELVSGKVLELVYAHDSVRVIQCCLKFGDESLRSDMFNEVKDHILNMSKCKYAKFFVKQMLRYGTKEQRNHIMSSFHGSVCKMVRHKEASEVIEMAYNNHANLKQRSALLEEFYGPSFAVFKKEGVESLNDIIEAEPEKKRQITEHMAKTLTSMVDKTVIKHTMIHKVLYDFFVHARPQLRSEMIESIREVVVQILHTHDGARVAMQCVWHGTAKDRKVIMKSFKTYVSKICREEYGHWVMLALLDSVDDTKLLSKIVLNEMMKCVGELCDNQYGRKVLLYLLCHRQQLHFHPHIITLLKKGDENATSKKDLNTRRQEVLEAVSKPLLKHVQSHARELVRNKQTCLLVTAIFQNAVGDKKLAMEAICNLASEDLVAIDRDSTNSLDKMHIVEHPAGHIVLKKLIQQDKETQNSDFSEMLVEKVGTEKIATWSTINRGAFILVCLLDCGSDSVKTNIKEAMTPMMKVLQKADFKGAQVLEDRLK